jgi:hypothetical protein
LRYTGRTLLPLLARSCHVSSSRAGQDPSPVPLQWHSVVPPKTRISSILVAAAPGRPGALVPRSSSPLLTQPSPHLYQPQPASLLTRHSPPNPLLFPALSPSSTTSNYTFSHLSLTIFNHLTNLTPLASLPLSSGPLFSHLPLLRNPPTPNFNLFFFPLIFLQSFLNFFTLCHLSLHYFSFFSFFSTLVQIL